MVTLVSAPGRVNLIGDHTDYTGGRVLPMAIDRWTSIEYERATGTIDLMSADEPEPLHLALPVSDAARVQPAWGRYVAGVAAEMASTIGFSGNVSTTIPIGSGLSSSAALEVAVALALGHEGSRLDLALLCQRAEQLASGVPCGVMDQLCIATATAGHASLIDCGDLTVVPVPIPETAGIVVTFVAPRRLAGSDYADRVAECARAEQIIGPLRDATPRDVDAIDDPLLARRARHVITENMRVLHAAEAMADGRLDLVGALMVESHHSLANDFSTSTAQMDTAVTEMMRQDGVHGARMTGGGFGGCIVALVDVSRAEVVADAVGGWVVRAVGAASVA